LNSAALNSAAWVDWVVAALLVGGAAFALVGSYGLAKLSDFYKRLHGPTKATTLGVGGVLLASCLYFVTAGRGGTEQILVALFLFITAPVSAHLLVKAVLSLTTDRPPPPSPSEPAAPDEGRTGQ
jgi:multicomponent K+:H+ antiporter subunit G